MLIRTNLAEDEKVAIYKIVISKYIYAFSRCWHEFYPPDIEEKHIKKIHWKTKCPKCWKFSSKVRKRDLNPIAYNINYSNNKYWKFINKLNFF